jgi:NnrU protein
VASLFAAALFFDGIHFVISGAALRGKIVGLIGERAFQGLFSLMSLIGIVWLSRAYGQAEYLQLWAEPQALRPVALIVMLIAFFFVVLGLTSPSPTAVGGGALLTEKEPAKGIQRVTRHPFLWGGRGTVFNRSKTQVRFRRCLESIRCPDLQCSVYSNHRGSQLASDRRTGMVAPGSVLGLLRFVSLLSQNSFRRLSVADVSRKIKGGSGRYGA